jgi:hypothetical protein
MSVVFFYLFKIAFPSIGSTILSTVFFYLLSVTDLIIGSSLKGSTVTSLNVAGVYVPPFPS